MHPRLQQLIDRLESQRKSVLNDFRSMGADRFHQSPAPGKWSAAEILSHVIAAERLSIAYMQKKFLGIEQAAQSGLKEEVKMAILKVSQRVPGFKFKAPKKVVENTSVYKDLAGVESTWENVREELRTFLEQVQPHHLDRLIYKHPVAGYLNVQQAVMFFREHLIHHTPQLKKLLK